MFLNSFSSSIIFLEEDEMTRKRIVIDSDSSNNNKYFNKVLIWATLIALTTLITELYGSTAYGKFADGAYIVLPQRLGWFLMELPCSSCFIYFFFIKGGPQSHLFVPRLLAFIFLGHYLYRGWIFPYLARPSPSGGNNFSVIPAIGGWLVTITHGYLNARWYSTYGTHLKDKKWLKSPFFILGLILYYSGFFCLVWHDKIVRDLRDPTDINGPRYKIPYGGFFTYVTAAQYFVELWTWFGFFLMSCGPNGFFIFVVSLFNLAPRAAVTHQWYIQKFGKEYEDLNRKNLIPGVW